MEYLMKFAKKMVLVTSLLFSVLILGCQKQEATVAVPVEEQKTIYAVNTYITKSENLDDYLEFGGDVSAVSSVDVLPDTSGKLTNIRVKVGDYVTKNQILAEVDASRAGMTYQASPIKAPVSGTITSFPVSTGSMVAPSMSIGKISSTNNLEVVISVAERFVSRIKQGQKALLTFDAYPGEFFSAKVTEVNPILDTASRSMTVKLRLDPPDSRIKIGMYSRVKLITETKINAIAIPRNAVVSRGGASYVFVVEPNTNIVEARPVTVGITVDDMAEITSGLVVGEEVVVSGQTLLENGSTVNVVSREGGN